MAATKKKLSLKTLLSKEEKGKLLCKRIAVSKLLFKQLKFDLLGYLTEHKQVNPKKIVRTIFQEASVNTNENNVDTESLIKALGATMPVMAVPKKPDRTDLIRKAHERIKSLVYTGINLGTSLRHGYIDRNTHHILAGNKYLMLYLLDYIWERSRTFGSLYSHEPQKVIRFGLCANTYITKTADCTVDCLISPTDWLSSLDNPVKFNKLVQHACTVVGGKPDLIILDSVKLLHLADKVRPDASAVLKLSEQLRQLGAAIIFGCFTETELPIQTKITSKLTATSIMLMTNDDGKTCINIGNTDSVNLPKRIADKVLQLK